MYYFIRYEIVITSKTGSSVFHRLFKNCALVANILDPAILFLPVSKQLYHLHEKLVCLFQIVLYKQWAPNLIIYIMRTVKAEQTF